MTTTLEPGTDLAAPEAVEELLGRLFTESVGAFHLAAVYLGVQHDLFATLADAGPLTAAELAERTGLDAWYLREWLQAEATAGLVLPDGVDLDVARFRAAPGVRETLVDPTHPAYVGGLPLAAAAVYSVLPQLLGAFRTGAGVPYAAYGTDAVAAQAALNRPAFANQLVTDWIPQVPGLADRLADRTRPARVADVGCGAGWAAIELARAYPQLRIDGFDTDEASITQARRNAAAAGLGDRVNFDVVDAATGYGEGRYDLILFLECVHDLAHPVEALTRARTAVAEGGTVLVMDERVAESFVPGDAVELFFATASVLWCLPQGRVEPDSEAIGAVMRPDRFRAVASRAGWGGVEVLGIDHPFWRFYRLVA